MAAVYGRILHTLAHRIGLSDEEYKQALMDNCGVSSSKDLTATQFKELRDSWQAILGGGSGKKYGWGAKKYETLYRRPQDASAKQLRMIEAMWAEVCRAKGVSSRENTLDEFLHNKGYCSSIVYLQKKDVERVRKAIESMGQK